MAAVLLADKLVHAGLAETWLVESAGTWALDNAPATANAKQAVRERGLNLEEHNSRTVNAELLEAADLILVMEKNHREALITEFPQVADRVHLLATMAGPAYSIVDPVGLDLAGYRVTLKELDDLMERGFENILKLANPGVLGSES